ncbi:hypothetical protein JB92DRAFT_2620614, partial [Gautieria morchelliformis]
RQHLQLPPDQQYLRCIETVHLPDHDPFTIIICMFPAMSHLLLATRWPSIDTAFKRADLYEEFELEAWFPEHMKSIICTRAFITSQSAAAHQYLFQSILALVEHDTGHPVHFRHIHGDGFETIVADAHKGQALGLGQLCASMSHHMGHRCSYPCACELRTMAPYKHLQHCFMLCVNHFQRGIHKLGNDVSPEVRTAMHSLVSTSPLPDLQGTKELIHSGGPQAAAWLHDKEIGSPFVIPAIYQPESHIPLAIWKACPSTSNGNEQAHRNVNRDGTGLTLLAAIMRGMHYHKRAMATVDLMHSSGIHQR